MTGNACARALLRQLARSGGWAGRDQLRQAARDYSDGRVDDELADLVVAGEVSYNERAREYRLAAGPHARRALKLLLAEPAHAQRVIGTRTADGRGYMLGFAARVDAGTPQERYAVAEIELPEAGPQDMAAVMAGLWRALEPADVPAAGGAA